MTKTTRQELFKAEIEKFLLDPSPSIKVDLYNWEQAGYDDENIFLKSYSGSINLKVPKGLTKGQTMKRAITFSQDDFVAPLLPIENVYLHETRKSSSLKLDFRFSNIAFYAKSNLHCSISTEDLRRILYFGNIIGAGIILRKDAYEAPVHFVLDSGVEAVIAPSLMPKIRNFGSIRWKKVKPMSGKLLNYIRDKIPKKKGKKKAEDPKKIEEPEEEKELCSICQEKPATQGDLCKSCYEIDAQIAQGESPKLPSVTIPFDKAFRIFSYMKYATKVLFVFSKNGFFVQRLKTDLHVAGTSSCQYDGKFAAYGSPKRIYNHLRENQGRDLTLVPSEKGIDFIIGESAKILPIKLGKPTKMPKRKGDSLVRISAFTADIKKSCSKFATEMRPDAKEKLAAIAKRENIYLLLQGHLDAPIKMSGGHKGNKKNVAGFNAKEFITAMTSASRKNAHIAEFAEVEFIHNKKPKRVKYFACLDEEEQPEFIIYPGECL